MRHTIFFLSWMGTVCIINFCKVQSAPVEVKNPVDAVGYLSKFGYLEEAKSKDPDSLLSGKIRDLTQAIKSFQQFAGINVTGNLDELTMELMNTPRCGVKDDITSGARRKKRYALQGSRWRKRKLNYRIASYPLTRRLSKATTDDEIDKAFKVWANVANLDFQQVFSQFDKIHIDVRFEKGEHGDGDPFDGTGGTLAHAYFPVYGGDAHFDSEEKWSSHSYSGTNLFQVAAHEFGHSLGLSHSDVRGALMAPFYRGYQKTFKLHRDDIDAIQRLYGERLETKSDSTPSGSDSSDTEGGNNEVLCNSPKIDAIVTTPDKNTYCFKGSKYYRLTDNGIYKGYPKPLLDLGLPSNLDAAFTYSNGKTFIFKGTQYWRLKNLTVEKGYPKEISEGFPGIPNYIDAAFVWSGNGKLYFFKGEKYWKFDPTRTTKVSGAYPKAISSWSGIPNHIDAALKYSNGYTYFFKDDEYWRFNDRTFTVDTGKNSFPRPVGKWWYGCEKSNMKNSG